MTNAAPIAIRLAGGIGAHLLGMRSLSLAHARMPDRPIIVYSDGANGPAAMKVAALSPFVSEVIAGHGAADAWIDASGEDLFAKTAVALRMPLFEFLAARPVLRIPAWAATEADRFLHGLRASSFVGVCFASEEPETLRQFQPRILEATRMALALASADALALNFLTTPSSFELSTLDARIVPCAGLPIEAVAALLRRCRYFVGGDNGIKHLAWALDIPRTFFVKERPPQLEILRWMPDVHRMLSFDCSDERLRRHLDHAVAR